MAKSRGFGELLLGISHFFVDFLCTALLASHTGTLDGESILSLAILYNGLAFAFQLPLGAMGDLLDGRRSFAAIGCLLVAAGSFIPSPVFMCLCIGLGNALFHVGGGRESLQKSDNKAAAVGRFVAPGAVGIFLGPRLANILWLRSFALPGVLLILAVLLLALRAKYSPAVFPKRGFSPIRLACILSCMFLTVFLRSYMGTVLRFSFLTHLFGAASFTVCVFLGKFFGGSLADRFGVLPFSAAAQVACVLCFTLSVPFPWLAYPGIFLFNTTMAITATELYRCLPHLPGTMFGLTTLALFLGVLPRLLGLANIFFSWWGLGLLSLISAVSLLGGLILGKGGEKDANISCSVPGSYPSD